MSNKQKKPPQTSRERLAQISHHFLSDEEADESLSSNDVYTLALLNTANDDEELPVFMLSRQLAALGRSSVIFDCTYGLKMTAFIPRTENQQASTHQPCPGRYSMEDAVRQLTNVPGPDLHLLLVDTPESACLSSTSRVLITATGTPEGLQHSYLLIKQLAARDHTIQTGVTITGTTDQSRAEYCYNKLATAVHRFLGRHLLSYGYLPASVYVPGQSTTHLTAQLSQKSRAIAAVADIINDDILECKRSGAQNDRTNNMTINSTPSNVQ